MGFDLLRYGTVCVVLVAAGFGLCRAIRLRLAGGAALLLAPAIMQAVWGCVLSTAVLAGIPMRLVWAPFWACNAALAIYGLRRIHLDFFRGTEAAAAGGRVPWDLAASAMALPLAVMLPFVVYGLADYPGGGAASFDRWAYIVYGQYIWEYPRATEGGLSPVHQWAVHLSHTRHTSSAQLGMLSVFGRLGDTQSASGLFQLVGLFSFASACAAVAHVRRLTRSVSYLYVVFATLSGWTLNVVWADNFDNLLALIYVPAFAALAAQPAVLSFSGWMLAGVMAGGAVHTYPEFAALTLGGASLMLAEQIYKSRQWKWIGGFVIAGSVMAVAISFYATDLMAFWRAQLSAGMASGMRPGDGLLLGLLERTYLLSALWGFGGEHLQHEWLPGASVASATLFVLMLLGAVRLVTRGEIGMSAILALSVGGAAFFLIRRQYPYGTYKLILFGWSVISLAVVLGVSMLLSLPRRWRWIGLGAFAAVALAVLFPVRRVAAMTQPPAASIASYRAVERIIPLVGQEPVALISDDVWASHWAAYFLRGTTFNLHVYGGYLWAPHTRPLLERARSVPWDQTRFVLLDTKQDGPVIESGDWTLVWGGRVFSLWDTRGRGWATVTDARGPLSAAPIVTRPAFEVGTRKVAFEILATTAGAVRLSGDVDPAYAQLFRVSTPTADLRATVSPAGTLDIELPVPAGRSCIWLALDTSGEALAMTDHMVAIRRLRTTFRPSGAGTADIHLQQAANAAPAGVYDARCQVPAP